MRPVIRTPPATPPTPPKKRNWGCLIAAGITVLIAGAGCFALILFSGVITAVVAGVESSGVSLHEGGGVRVQESVIQKGAPGCSDKIAVIDVAGIIRGIGPQSMGGRVCAELAAARRDENVKAILLDMNTPGGEVTASDEIHRQVNKCREAGKSVVTCMHAMGASGGYYIACASDHIIANRLTMTGSVGVIISTVNYKELFDKIGLKGETYASGKMKDMLSGSRMRRDDEKVFVQGMVNQTFTEFCKIVADGRPDFADVEAVKATPFADGRILSGAEAKEAGLVDQLGYFEDAIAKARELSGSPGAKVVRFRRVRGLQDILMSMQAKKTGLKSLLPEEMSAIEPGRMYFLMPTVIP